MPDNPTLMKRLNWISEKLPNLKIQNWKIDNKGWDNFVIIINDSWIFRFPRNIQVQKRLIVEKQLLSQIRDPLNEINIQVPNYKLLYDSTDNLPICCYYKIIKGVPLDRGLIQKLSGSLRRKLTDSLGDALAVIHSFDLAARDFPVLEEEQTEKYWKNHWADIKLKILPYLAKSEQEKVENLFESFLEEWNITNLPKTLIHCDLSHAHIIYSEKEKRISGIIDFGDAKIGDPAYDFSGLYWDYGNDFLLQTLARYRQHTQLKYDIFDLYRRVASFYGKRPIFFDLLHALENGSSTDFNNQLNVLRHSLR
ncbi:MULTISPECIES: phosphotransferase family protein [unclassified Bacillus (in: firmicutes)]|uniref:phosphotransferase family protein n=1 Tax=unclassified Bacillus (in: firmicutes) TaxID=185979 RepID=UPI000BF6DE58|nr:aminoglycoside phosphotransferase family protein [Bacillus sp. AFS059628]PFV83097.1 hypothetical protein COL05_09060 [Bacillus sp. AFS059628]